MNQSIMIKKKKKYCENDRDAIFQNTLNPSTRRDIRLPCILILDQNSANSVVLNGISCGLDHFFMMSLAIRTA